MNLTGMSDLLSFMKQYWPTLYLHSASVANFTCKICNLLGVDEIHQSKMMEGAILKKLLAVMPISLNLSLTILMDEW